MYVVILFLQGGTVKITDKAKPDPRDLPEKLVPKVKISSGMHLKAKKKKMQKKEKKASIRHSRPARHLQKQTYH